MSTYLLVKLYVRGEKMIEGVSSGGVYNEYPIKNEQAARGVEQTGSKKIEFDLQSILSQIKEYTYTEQDTQAVDKNLLSQLKEQYDLKEEDVYELYKKGVDLDKLRISELAYRANSKTPQVKEDEETKKEDKTLQEKIELIKKENDSMYLNVLKAHGDVTINSLYESNFKGEVKKGISQYKKEEVDNVLKMNGLETNKGNEWAANLLMMYDMGVSPTSINRLQGIRSAVESLDVTTGLSGDEPLIKEDQVQYEPEYVGRITDDLGMVTDEHIEKLIEEGKEINIDELRQSIHKNASEALEEHNGQSAKEESNEQGNHEEKKLLQSVDEVKRQILQITTKLTVEAAQKISARMPLESSSLQAIAEALTQMEQEMAVEALNEVNLPVTEENITAVTNVVDTVNEIKEQFVPTVEIELATDEKITLNEISDAIAHYMENETPVEARFGESIKTVEAQIAHLLESQQIEATKTNIEAAKALITNGLEVTEEALQDIQEVVIKLNTFLEEMTPIQVATMLKEGFNPYTASVNDILSWLSQEKTEGLKTSVAEAIVELESSKQINEEQKEGMIGIYRILQAVTNQKEQVMGYLYRNELPITVENLQIAAKYVNGKHRIEKVVDDDFGELQNSLENEETASKMLQKSESESKKMLDIVRMLEEMELPITEGNIDRVSKMSALLYPYIKEQFKKEIGKFDGMKTLPESFLQKLEAVQNADPEVIENMLKQDIPVTLTNIYWMDKINHSPEIYGELLNDKGLLKEGLPNDLEELEERLKEIEVKAKEHKEEATLSGNMRSYRSYKQLEEIVGFQRQRIENEGMYQIPFMIDGQRRMVNLYVHQEKENSVQDASHLKAIISYDTKNMGNVKAYIEMRGEQLGYRIETEDKANYESLRQHAESLMEGLKSIGYNVGYSEYVQEVTEEESQVIVHKHEDSAFEEMI